MQTTRGISDFNALRHPSNGACRQFGAGIRPDNQAETYCHGALAIHSYTEENPPHSLVYMLKDTSIEKPNVFSIINNVRLLLFYTYFDQGLKPSPNPVSLLDHCKIYAYGHARALSAWVCPFVIVHREQALLDISKHFLPTIVSIA
ncbi:MAG: hypothetical protein JW920_02115 [Deltaproteobacteria bacterium]|nr:hypothetical protein [Deltaproteobacteria bacterium]